MKNLTILALSYASIAFSASAFADTSYQATGPVLEVTDSKIVIQKDKEKWEIARTADTKVTGDLKVGSKVTIQYTMSASTVEVKPGKAAAAVKEAAPAKPMAPAAPAAKKSDKKP